jgi:4-alpha-glucanotransferase
LRAVQTGARLYSTPDDPRHPVLAKYAIARPEQLDRRQPSHADGWVRELDRDQVARYSMLVDLVVELQAAHDRRPDAIACEVLSTLPYPVRRVMERHGLGRFRVTQKINLSDPADVYRIERAAPEDWIMMSTHDTPTVWQLAQSWCDGGQGAAWGKYLSEQLAAPALHEELASQAAHHPGQLVHMLFSAMLASRARHVVVFFPDLLGMTQRYNEPGVISQSHWTLRVPNDFESYYDERRRAGAALDITRCFRMALDRTAGT